MEHIDRERRKYPRYDTGLNIYYRVKYDIKTRVKFRVIVDGLKRLMGHKYSGVSENISIEGMRFASRKKLNEGDLLQLEVYAPNTNKPVSMEGRVVWSEKIQPAGAGDGMFHTGVEIFAIKGKPVADSIHYDKEYKVMWSDVLESLFSTFSGMVKHLKK